MSTVSVFLKGEAKAQVHEGKSSDFQSAIKYMGSWAVITMDGKKVAYPAENVQYIIENFR